MLLHLFSDANYNLLGFNATYTFSLCPGACGGHGRCDSSTSKCHCHQGWGGPSCTTPLCTQACSVNGQCDKVRVGIGTIKWTHTKNIYYSRTVTRFSTWLGYSFVCRDETSYLPSFIYLFFQKGERCLCKPGFVGQNCQLGLYNDSGAGKWWRVSEENPYTPPRTGSAGVYLSSTGAMYLFGGKSNTQLNSTDTIFLLRKTFLTHKTTARFLTLILWYMLIIITQHNLLLCYILTISDVDVFVRAECQCLSHQSHISLLALFELYFAYRLCRIWSEQSSWWLDQIQFYIQPMGKQVLWSFTCKWTYTQTCAVFLSFCYCICFVILYANKCPSYCQHFTINWSSKCHVGKKCSFLNQENGFKDIHSKIFSQWLVRPQLILWQPGTQEQLWNQDFFLK